MNTLPAYISLIFGISTLLTVFLFVKASKRPAVTMVILFLWLFVQGIVGRSGFYTITNSIPPRFILLVLPPVLFIIGLFITKRGRGYIDCLDIKTLTLLHTIRIPVELVLFWLFSHAVIPKLMTFEGRNFDILSGLTAPVIWYVGFIQKKISRNVLLLWNLICLGLLFNIVIIAVLSAPFPFQQFAFDQPNIAILYFPFVWLPCCVVPLVLFAHLATIRSLINKWN